MSETASYTCPRCGATNSVEQRYCGHCAAPLAVQVVGAPVRSAWVPPLWLYLLGLIVLVVVLFCGVTMFVYNPNARVTDPLVSAAPEVRLASMDSGTFVAADDARVVRYRYLLSEISRYAGYSPDRIAAATSQGYETLHTKYGKTTTNLQLLEAANQMMASTPSNHDYASVLAVLIVTDGNSP